MWSRIELKTNAKNILRQRYWIPFLVSLIAGLLSGDNSGGGYGISYSFSGSSGELFGSSNNISTEALLIFIGAMFLIFSVVFIFAIAFVVFLGNPIKVGAKRFYMENRERETSLVKMFSSFNKNYINVVKVMFMQGLFIFLWSLLFIIPGIIKSYEYRMVPYILSENPDLSWRRALEISREMTRNEKWNIFVLDLSFLGWILLGLLACCIGILFVQPYVDATNAELYQKMREKAFSNNISSTEELPGFEGQA